MRMIALLFVTAGVTAGAFALPAQAAENKPLFTTTTATTPVKSSDRQTVPAADVLRAQGMSEMPDMNYSNTQILDADGDGVPDAQDKEISIPNPFAPQEQKEETKPKKKQVYKGIPDMDLQRTIRDPRIDDGYVQGLMQQRAISNNQ